MSEQRATALEVFGPERRDKAATALEAWIRLVVMDVLEPLVKRIEKLEREARP